MGEWANVQVCLMDWNRFSTFSSIFHHAEDWFILMAFIVNFPNNKKDFLFKFSRNISFFPFFSFSPFTLTLSKQIDFNCFWHFTYINRDHLKMIVDLNPKQSNWCLFRWIFITALAWIFYYYLLLKSSYRYRQLCYDYFTCKY